MAAAFAMTFALCGAAAGADEPTAATCPENTPHVRVLGSGGPETADRRASSAYLVHDGGRNRVLVDAGGGAALRFGQAGGRVAELDAVLFTHLHADHSADFPALVKSSYFERRARRLVVAGPAAGGDYPGTPDFVEALIGARGAWRYLAGHLDPASGDYAIDARSVGTGLRAAKAEADDDAVPGNDVLAIEGLDVRAAMVAHGPVPALAWRVELPNLSVTFSGDTNGDGEALTRLARGTGIFVAHHAVPEDASGAARRLHMPPSRIGRIAADAGVGRLVLSHRMTRTLGREAESLAAIRAHYDGPVAFADDLDCFTGPR